MESSKIHSLLICDIALINAHSVKTSYAPSHIEYIDISSVGTGEFTEPPKLMSFADAPSRARRIVKAGDTILSTVRPNRRSFLFLSSPSPIAVASTGFAVLTPTPNVDPRYLYYWVTRQEFTDYLSLHAKGAAYPAVSTEDIGGAEIVVPPLPEQHRIGGILSSYDELIENSQRRIKILESMARVLYREWFIHFRYPGSGRETGNEPSTRPDGHPSPRGRREGNDTENNYPSTFGRGAKGAGAEFDPHVESALGKIPKGWEVKCVPECIHVNPRVSVPRESEKPFVPMGCLSTDSMLITDIESRDGNSGAKFQNGDTLFARITPCLENGKTGFVQFLPDADAVAFGSTEFIVLRSRTVTPEFVYCLARSEEFRGVAIKSMSGASGRQRVQEQCFNDFQIVHPPLALLNLFSDIVAPSFRLIYMLHLQIQNLRRTRDLLLPRLLSGQVNLKGTD
jgi:type I restriction enzyme S subunit